jgi:predicted RNA-binding protein
MRYWVGVASREHVLVGVQGGFAQFNHGKLAPAKRPAKGDWLIYYSGKERFGEKAPCQRFVAIGEVLDSEPTQVLQAPGFKPWRRRVRYREATEVEIEPLIDQLSFIKNRSKWGAAFRFGFLEISESDFELISSRMQQHGA